MINYYLFDHVIYAQIIDGVDVYRKAIIWIQDGVAYAFIGPRGCCESVCYSVPKHQPIERELAEQSALRAVISLLENRLGGRVLYEIKPSGVATKDFIDLCK